MLLNGVLPDTKILHIIIQQKLETSTKLRERTPSALAFLAMKINKNFQSMYQKKYCE